MLSNLKCFQPLSALRYRNNWLAVNRHSQKRIAPKTVKNKKSVKNNVLVTIQSGCWWTWTCRTGCPTVCWWQTLDCPSVRRTLCCRRSRPEWCPAPALERASYAPAESAFLQPVSREMDDLNPNKLQYTPHIRPSQDQAMAGTQKKLDNQRRKTSNFTSSKTSKLVAKQVYKTKPSGPLFHLN